MKLKLKRPFALMVAGIALTASLQAAQPAAAQGITGYCSDWDSQGACIRQTFYETYGTESNRIMCASTYIYTGFRNGAHQWDLRDVFCSSARGGALMEELEYFEY